MWGVLFLPGYNSRKGRKPEADYRMTGFVEGDALYVVPVAAKKTISEKNIAQITQYMANLCKGRYVRRLCTVGLLLNQSNVRLCFSALALESGNNNIPLPITSANHSSKPGFAVEARYNSKRTSLQSDGTVQQF